MARRFLTILTGNSPPKIWQPREAAPSIINESPSLALQLPICFKVRALSDCLVSSAPE
jgi:hypothetical protein